MSNVTTVTAAEVRNFFRADDKRMSVLSPEAQATVSEGAKGRLHAEAIALHNKRRRTRQYVLGATTQAKAEAQATRARLVEAGLAGKRGRLSAAAVEFLAADAE